METTKEDLDEILNVAEMLAQHTNRFEAKMTERMGKLEVAVRELKKGGGGAPPTHREAAVTLLPLERHQIQ